MPYRKSPLQIKAKHTINQYNPDEYLWTFLSSTSPPNMLSSYNGTMVELHHIFSAANFPL